MWHLTSDLGGQDAADVSNSRKTGKIGKKQ